MLPKIDLEPLLSARTEVAFWAAFESAHLAMSAMPNCALVLWTPTAPYLMFFGRTAATRELKEIDSDAFTCRGIGPLRMGDIRRDVRRGQWVLSARDTRMQWSVLCDGRDRRITFQDPMAASSELGLARAAGLARFQGALA